MTRKNGLQTQGNQPSQRSGYLEKNKILTRNFLAENTRISLNVVGFLEIFFKEFICIKKENYLVNVYNLSSQLISIRLSPFLKFIHLRYVISNLFHPKFAVARAFIFIHGIS